MERWFSVLAIWTLVSLLVACSASDREAEQTMSRATVQATETQSPTATSYAPASTTESTRTTVPTATSAPTPTSPPTPAMVLASTDDVQRITPAEAKALVDGGRAVLYDTRAAEAYRIRHAAGAVSLPEAEVPGRLDELPSDKALIFYCT